MKLLFVTQVLDQNDSVLGAYHGWTRSLANQLEKVTVICLREGEHSLPSNVEVYSLGKEKGPRSRLAYTMRFLSLAWRLRSEYNVVLVHMNQEYILIAGWLWKLLGKRIYMWRNHYAGSFLTDIAAGFCTKVFCTSRQSYTAKYSKTVFMPVGIDTNVFSEKEGTMRQPHSVLFLARMAPSKHPDVLIDALAIVAAKCIEFTATFVGSPLPKDEAYYLSLKQKAQKEGLSRKISFVPGIPNIQTPSVYRAHDIFVNCSPGGMLDKTIFESLACGALGVSASADMRILAGPEYVYDGSANDLARVLEVMLTLSPAERAARMATLKSVVTKNTLAELTTKLVQEIST